MPLISQGRCSVCHIGHVWWQTLAWSRWLSAMMSTEQNSSQPLDPTHHRSQWPKEYKPILDLHFYHHYCCASWSQRSEQLLLKTLPLLTSWVNQTVRSLKSQMLQVTLWTQIHSLKSNWVYSASKSCFANCILAFKGGPLPQRIKLAQDFGH